jgi:hypothetical protein
VQGAFEHRHTCMGGEAKAQRLSHAHVGCADDEPHGHAREARDRRKRCGEIRDPRSFCVSLSASTHFLPCWGNALLCWRPLQGGHLFALFSSSLCVAEKPERGRETLSSVRVPLSPFGSWESVRGSTWIKGFPVARGRARDSVGWSLAFPRGETGHFRVVAEPTIVNRPSWSPTST